MIFTQSSKPNESGLWLIGKSEKSLDEKNRLVIPSIFRKALGSEELILTRWFDGALALFPASVWKPMAKAIGQMPLFSPRQRRMRLTFFSGAIPQYMDNQGRIVLSDEMKDYAGIESEAVLLGDWDKIQIWSKHRYKDFRKRNDISLDEEYEETLARLAAGQHFGTPPQEQPMDTEDIAAGGKSHIDSPEAEDDAK